MNLCSKERAGDVLQQLRFFPTSPTDEHIAFALKQVTYARIDNWLDTDLNTFSWWLEVVLAVVFLLIWWRLVDKKRLLELTFFGFVVMTISIWLDEVGYELGRWYYPVDLIPVFPPSTAIDYIGIPVLYALVYQYCGNWKSFLAGITVLAGVFSFGLEPLLLKYGFYVIVDWKLYYDFPTYILIGVIMKVIVNWIKAVMASSRSGVGSRPF
jgi:hypothetical protein